MTKKELLEAIKDAPDDAEILCEGWEVNDAWYEEDGHCIVMD